MEDTRRDAGRAGCVPARGGPMGEDEGAPNAPEKKGWGWGLWVLVILGGLFVLAGAGLLLLILTFPKC